MWPKPFAMNLTGNKLYKQKCILTIEFCDIFFQYIIIESNFKKNMFFFFRYWPLSFVVDLVLYDQSVTQFDQP